MFQPLSAYTANPQMQQQQAFVDALRGDGAVPVDGEQQAAMAAPAMPTMQGGAPTLSGGRGLGQLFNGRALSSGFAKMIGFPMPPAQGGG